MPAKVWKHVSMRQLPTALSSSGSLPEPPLFLQDHCFLLLPTASHNKLPISKPEWSCQCEKPIVPVFLLSEFQWSFVLQDSLQCPWMAWDVLSSSSHPASSYFDGFMPAMLDLSLHGTGQHYLIPKFTYVLFCSVREPLCGLCNDLLSA